MKLKDSDFFTTHNKEHVYDSLTNTINKEYMIKFVNHLIETGVMFSLYFIDIDDFKKINESKGILLSDQLLKDIAEGIESTLNDRGLLFRYGGDEFVVITPNIATYEDVWNIARDISETVRHLKLDYLGDDLGPYPVTLTIGISRYPIDAKSLTDIMENSDKALFRGKMKGKNCFIIYNRNLHGDIDVAKKKSNLNVHGLIDYIFEMYKTHDKDEALKMVSHMLGNYYSAKTISLIKKNESVLLYQDVQTKSLAAPTLRNFDYHFESEENYMIYYRSLLKKDDPYESSFLPLMDRRKTRSFVIFKINDKEDNLLLIESGIEKVWSDIEILLYAMMVHSYSLIEHISHQN